MKCPIDNTTLAISERQGIEIDYCPECRGVWLDRGELDKLITKSESSPHHPDSSSHYGYSQPPQRSEHHDYSYEKHHKKKHESFLGDLFDF